MFALACAEAEAAALGLVHVHLGASRASLLGGPAQSAPSKDQAHTKSKQAHKAHFPYVKGRWIP
jgi:hypothetical protein